jgi:hypothetical protein
MKIPLILSCSNCGKPAAIKIHLDSTTFDWTCESCGTQHPTLLGLEYTVGVLILERSRYELVTEKDYSLSIILAATAFESEISRLFIKWIRIDRSAAQFVTEEQVEEELRQFRTIKDKLEATCKLMDLRGIDEFVKSNPELSETLERFPSLTVGNLSKEFQQTVFWPRNRILHLGYAKYTEAEATKIFSIALLGNHILREMDDQRRRLFNASQR